jgi:hypothetical protein
MNAFFKTHAMDSAILLQGRHDYYLSLQFVSLVLT